MKKFTLSLVALLLACGAASAQINTDTSRESRIQDRWTRDIVRISDELVDTAERMPQCEASQYPLRRARLLVEHMQKRASADTTARARFNQATLYMTSVTNNVRQAMEACQP